MEEFDFRSPEAIKNFNPLTIYTDGACRGNGSELAIAGWGFVTEKMVKKSGVVRGRSTSNSAELEAIRQALLYSMENNYPDVIIYSDSDYAINSVSQWNIEKLIKGQKKANYSLIKDIIFLISLFSFVDFKWVKGHSEDSMNDIADALAVNATYDYVGL